SAPGSAVAYAHVSAPHPPMSPGTPAAPPVHVWPALPASRAPRAHLPLPAPDRSFPLPTPFILLLSSHGPCFAQPRIWGVFGWGLTGRWQRILIHMSVQSRLWAGLALLTATLAVVISVALTLPVTGWRFQATTEALLASQADQPATAVDHFLDDNRRIEALPSLAIEEPDMVPTYADYN